MVNNISKLRSHRSFRIPVTSEDKIQFSVSTSSNIEENLIGGIELVNLSLSGVGFYSRTNMQLNQTYYVALSFKGVEFFISSRLTRVNQILNDYGECIKYFCGLEFDVEQQGMSKKFIEKFISSFSTKRLKNHLIELISNEGMVKKQTSLQKISLLKSLYQDMRKFDQLRSFQTVIFRETARVIKAKRYHFYTINRKRSQVVLYDFEKETLSDNVFSFRHSLVEKVLNERRIINTRITKFSTDPLYRELTEYYDIKTTSLMLIPVYDDQGSIVGILEFANKKGEDFFSGEDILFCEILSFTITSIWRDFHRTPLKDSELEFVQDQSFSLVGVSKQNDDLKRFVNMVKSTDETVLITGEYGVGKKLLAEMIHQESERKDLGRGVVNCHDVLDVKDLNDLLIGGDQKVGKLDLYSGGTIIFKDICSLTIECQNELLKLMKSRADIRFICTSPKSLIYLKNSSDFELSLFEEISKKMIHIPSLRERKEDIIPLMKLFLEKVCHEQGQYVKRLGPKIVDFFKNYDWPGNIQELKTAIDRLVLYNSSFHYIEEISPDVIPVIDVDLGQFHIFESILEGVEPEKLRSLSHADLETLYLTALSDKHLQKGLTLEEVADKFQMKVDAFRERLFHGRELYRNYFGIILEESESLAS
ncbi:sigma 54-interacting transcriptional regulator [Halobacteriovorax sp. GB3]|uniref:sigma 54-interacting transcriptional regulator n=1 Tax=Halobacteriovorax sp. GB3 TaxID=2719615 RepID=UPI002360F740|nr:sigma 54-interacting transcriptional regulator [Halobacteriovorax sp. GB3]MDD0853147.1 sigma 54-interacting transcriptional regulator [Halobacteriovorax sp. GB3]